MRFVLLNQTFYPDVMASGQYLSEVAVALAEGGHEVTVVTSRRAYDQPERQFPGAEAWRGVRILRVGSTRFGKGAKWRRGADFASFLLRSSWELLFLPKQDVVVALTSPPLISFLGACLSKLRGSRFVYWVMDFNPDEAIAAGWLRGGCLIAKLLEAISRFSLKRAERIIALDRFMRQRIQAKGIAPEKIIVVPPWSFDAHVAFDPVGRERFRKAHELEGKFVVMYSGNHSPCHPLDTLLEAARRLAGEAEIVFCFVGGGSEWRRIDVAVADPAVNRRSNLRLLPYQPIEELSASLSAADLHVVVMGDALVGLVHPCKVYNILRVGAPVLYIGPQPSHISEIFEQLDGEHICHRSGHGDVEGVVGFIRQVRLTAGGVGAKASGVARRGERSRPTEPPFSRDVLLPKVLGVLETDIRHKNGGTKM